MSLNNTNQTSANIFYLSDWYVCLPRIIIAVTVVAVAIVVVAIVIVAIVIVAVAIVIVAVLIHIIIFLAHISPVFSIPQKP